MIVLSLPHGRKRSGALLLGGGKCNIVGQHLSVQAGNALL